MSDDGGSRNRCDFCRLPCPETPVTDTYHGETYEFCSPACRDAMADSERVFTEYRGYRRFRPGVAGIDARLPEGMLRNSLVLLTGQAGTRDGAIQAEVVWRTLQRGEPAVVVSFQEPPVSVVERFSNLGWNVLPYLQNGQLHVVDCLTYRLDDRERMYERMNDWNQYLRGVVEDATTSVRDASDVRELENKIDGCLEARAMVDTGVVVIDSLTELGTLVQPIQAYDFVKDLRADVCKGRFVPVFAGATYSGDAEAFPHDLDYTADGVVDFELNSEIVPDTLLKRVRIRKMSGVLSISEWTAYEYTAGTGMVPFDPEEEMESADDQEGGSDGSGEASTDEATNDGDREADGDGDAGSPDGTETNGDPGSGTAVGGDDHAPEDASADDDAR